MRRDARRRFDAMRVVSSTWFAVVVAFVVIVVGVAVTNSSDVGGVRTLGRVIIGGGAFLGAIFVAISVRRRSSR
jgi:predicted exporter